jgi:hypothetical protein
LLSHLRLSSLSVASYDSQGYGGGILTRLHTGLMIVVLADFFKDAVGVIQVETAGNPIVHHVHLRTVNIPYGSSYPLSIPTCLQPDGNSHE